MSAKSDLHLAPRSQASRRQWVFDSTTHPCEVSPGDIVLRLGESGGHAFSGVSAFLDQLAHSASSGLSGDLARLNQYLEQVSARHTDRDRAVAFATTRRLSRESVYTGRIVDLGASVLNRLLAHASGSRRVHVCAVNRLDRATIKVLARAMLCLEDSHNFSWVWHFERSDPAAGGTGLVAESRAALFDLLSEILRPCEEPAAARSGLLPGPASVATDDLAAEVVVQNYDVCFVGLESGELRSPSELRLVAIAAFNVGFEGEAIKLLDEAVRGADGGPFAAHLSYLKGLILGKRALRLDASDEAYRVGHRYLDRVADSPAKSLERAWLLNGQALNEVIRWRTDRSQQSRFQDAFRLEQEAFDLVKSGEDPSQVYLRYNVVANCGFLMEMAGRYDAAISTFARAFELGESMDASSDSRWETTLAYRIGVLELKAGHPDSALKRLRSVRDAETRPENWPTRDHLLRAIGTAAFLAGDLDEAENAYQEGLDEAIAARSARGALAHAAGLSCVSRATGSTLPLSTMELELEGVEVPEVLAPTADSLDPKLPAYVPELDLEGHSGGTDQLAPRLAGPARMRVLVVGAGQVGSFAAGALDVAGCEVVACDLAPARGFYARYGPLAGGQLYEVDVRDAESVASLLEITRPDCIVIAAGLVGAACEEDPDAAHAANVAAPGILASAATQSGVARMILVSSFAVYGRQDAPALSEAAVPRPQSVYGRTKLAGEKRLIELSGQDLEVCALRPCGLFGPIRYLAGSHSARFVEAALVRAIRGGKVTLAGAPTTVDEYLYVVDLARAIAAVALGSCPAPSRAELSAGVACLSRVSREP